MSAMLFAVLPLVLVCFGVAGLAGLCSFSPGGPTIDQGSVPTVDVPAELRQAADRVDFPVLEPALPGNWRANAANVTDIGSGGQAVRVGWLTGAASYLRLVQSTAPEEQLVTAETGQPPHALGTVEAASRQWVIYQGIRAEKAWVGERDGVRLLITGNASDTEFRILANATRTAPALH